MGIDDHSHNEKGAQKAGTQKIPFPAACLVLFRAMYIHWRRSE